MPLDLQCSDSRRLSLRDLGMGKCYKYVIHPYSNKMRCSPDTSSLKLPWHGSVSDLSPVGQVSACPIAVPVVPVFLFTYLSSIPLPHRVFTWPLSTLVLNIFYGHFHSIKHGHGGVLPVGQGQALHQGGLGEGKDCQPLELSTNTRRGMGNMSSIVRMVSIPSYLRTQLFLGKGVKTS